MENSSTKKLKDDAEEPHLSADLLLAIGKRYYEERALAPPLHSEIAVRLQDLIEKDLPVDDKEELVKKYPLLENCIFSDPPKMNQEIKSVVSQAIIGRDARIIIKQQKIAACLSAIAKVVTTVISKKSFQDIQIIENLSDAFKLLADLQHDVSIRRSLIIANINASVKDTLVNTKCEEFLFGEKLDEIIKSAKALEATAKDLRVATKTQTQKQPKNSNHPPRPHPRDFEKTPGGSKPSSKRYRKSPNHLHRSSRTSDRPRKPRDSRSHYQRHR